MLIRNITQNTILAEQAQIADTSLKRMKGLLGREQLSSKEALLITHCQSIHMFFMKFAIDAVFMDKKEHVVGLVRNIKPGQLSPIFWKSACVIELPVGTIEVTRTQIGDKIAISPS